MRGDWPAVQQHWLEQRKNSRVAASDVTQIRAFYESGEETIFITFLDSTLFWCRPDGQVELKSDGTHQRSTTEGWHGSSLGGVPLGIDILPDTILRVRRFMGTICTVKDRDQFLNLVSDRLPH